MEWRKFRRGQGKFHFVVRIIDRETDLNEGDEPDVYLPPIAVFNRLKDAGNGKGKKRARPGEGGGSSTGTGGAFIALRQDAEDGAGGGEEHDRDSDATQAYEDGSGDEDNMLTAD